ncbi:EamA family transporter [Cupriavidus basilensis]
MAIRVSATGRRDLVTVIPSSARWRPAPSPPAEISFYRWLLAALLFTPLALRPVLRNWPAIRPRCGRIAVLGLLGMVAYQCLAYYAAYMTTATHMGIIGSRSRR